MRVLVTGAGGQLASALAETQPSGDLHCTFASRAELDLSDSTAIEAMVATTFPDVIINCGAYTAVDRAESEPQTAMRINGDAVDGLAIAAAKIDAKLVQISTDFVFDGATSRPYLPQDPANPLGAYGRSKLAGERAAANSPRALVLRTAWVYRAGGANFVETMLRLMAANGSVAVVSDQIGTPTHAGSLATAIWNLIACDATGIHHYTDAGVCSWFDFAVAISEEARAIGLLNAEVEVVPIRSGDFPQAALRPMFSVLDKTATWSVLGHAACHWRSELRKMLETRKEMSIG